MDKIILYRTDMDYETHFHVDTCVHPRCSYVNLTTILEYASTLVFSSVECMCVRCIYKIWTEGFGCLMIAIRETLSNNKLMKLSV